MKTIARCGIFMKRYGGVDCMKKLLYVLLLLVLPVLAACGAGDSAGVDKANEAHDPGKQRLEEGNVQAVMEATKSQFSRDDVTFYTYRFRNGELKMSLKVHNEDKQEEIVRTFADAFQNTEAKTLTIDCKGSGVYEVPLEEDYADLSPYFTPKE